MMASEYDLEDLLDATRHVESSGNRFAVGPPTKYGRAKGPYQFIDDTAREFGVADPFDEAQARAGARVKMGGLLKAYGGDTRAALAAWNWGEGNLAKHGMENAPEETRGFVQKVLNRLPLGSDAYAGPPPKSVVPAGGFPEPEIKPFIDTAFPESRESDRFRETMLRSDATPPDKAARLLKMQLRTGLPTGFIERNLDEVEAKAKREDFDPDKFRKENPKLSTWLAENPAHASIARNDLDNLSFLEKAWANFEAVPYGFAGGMEKQQLMTLNYRKVTGEITPEEEATRQQLNQASKERAQRFSTGAPSWVKAAADIIGMQVQPGLDAAREAAIGGLGGAGVGAVMGSVIPGFGTAAGASFGTLTGMRVASTASYVKSIYEASVGEVYGDLEDARDANNNPLDPTVIRYAAMIAGLPNSALETVSLGAAVKVIPGAGKLLGQLTTEGMKGLLAKPTMTAALKDFGVKYATAVGTETFTEGLQKFIGIVTREMVAGDNRTGITEQDLQAVAAEATEAFKGTVVLGGLGAPLKIIETRSDIARSQRDEAFMRAIGDVAGNSETASTSPEAMRGFIEQLKEGGPVKNVYVSRQSWDAVFGDKAQDAVAEVFGKDSTAYAESSITGDIVVPIETYVEKLAGTQFHERLIPDARLSPSGMSPNEREAAIAAEPQMIAQLQAEAQIAAEKEAPVVQVFEDVRSKLLQTGADEASAFRDAMLWREHIRARAERLGVDPWALYQENPLLVQREVTPEEGQLKQGALLQEGIPQNESPEFKNWFGGSKVVDPEGKPLVVYHGTKAALTEFQGNKATEKDSGWYGRGIYFTADPATASAYSGFEELQGGDAQPGANVLPVYVSLQNPYVWPKGRAAATTPQEAMALRTELEAAGHDGVIVPNEYAAPAYAGHYEVIAFRPEQIKSAIGNQGTFSPTSPNILYQAVRGMFAPQSNLIALLKDADPSTFLHETGHVWLEELRTDAQRPDAPEQVRQDWAAIKEWSGATDESISTEAHEKFARGIEAYVAMGHSPSNQLREVFARFKDWLTRIYKSLNMLDVELTPEVTAVMDRMLATDEAIKQAHEYNEYHNPLLDASMLTPEEYARYRELNEGAKTEAENTLRSQVMRELHRERTAEWRKHKDAATREAMAELDTQPIYRAMYWLSQGKMPDGKEIPGMDHARLSRTALEALGVDPEILPKRVPPILQKEGGLHPDVVAEMFGFASGRDFISELVSTPSRAAAVEALVTERMRSTYGDLLLDASLPERAAVEIQNTRQIEVFNMELRIMKRLGTTRTEVRPAVLKDLAKRMIEGKRVGELDPRQYEAAAIQAGQEAEAAMLGQEFRQGLGRNLEAAFDAKQRQMLNVMLYREAVEQKREIDRSMRQWKRLFKADTRLSKTRNMDLVNAARAVAAHRGIIAGQETAGEYMRALAAYDPQTYEDMKDLVETAISDNRGWQDLSVAEFASMRDTIDGLWTLSRRTKMIEIDGKRMDRQLVVDELAGRIRTLTGNAPERKGYHEAMTPWEKTKMGLLGVRAAGRRIESWANTMDNGDPNGVFRRYVWQPISDAANAYRDARRQYLKKYLDLAAPYGKHLPVGKISSPELDYTFTSKAELIGALLHTGNESNMQKLLRGREWGAFNASGEIDTARWDAFVKRMWAEKILTDTDYKFVQGVWDLLDTLKPQAQSAHRDMYGYYFSEVTAQAVQTPWGEFKGGYFPATVDSFLSEDAALRADKAATEDAPSSFLFPTTGRGFTRQRVEAYARPLSLDLALVPQHLQKVLRFIHLEPHVKDIGRVAIDRQFRSALTGLDTEFASTALVPWLQRAAKQTVDVPSTGRAGRMADSFFRELRARTGLQIMFANVTNTFLQFTGLSLALLKVNPRYLAGSLWRYTRSPSAYAEQIGERSVFMRNRTGAQVVEISQEIDNILLNPSKYEKAQAFAKQHGYFLQTATQNIVDLTVWGGAYEEALAGNSTEIEAARIADSAVRETQGTFAAEDISRIETLSPFLRLFTMFYSYFNMQANLLGTEFSKAMRRGGFGGAGRAFYVYVFGFMVPAMLSEMLAQAMGGSLFDDDDDDGNLDNLLSAFFTGQVKTAAGMVPGLGPATMAGINAFNDKWYDDRISTSPVISALEAAGRVPYDVYKVASGEGEARLKRPIQDTLTALSLVTGLPFAALGRPAGYLADVEQGYVEPEGPVDTARGLISGKAPK